MKYRVDIGKAFVAGTTGGVFLVIGAVAWAAGYDWLSAAAFAFTAIYVWLAVGTRPCCTVIKRGYIPGCADRNSAAAAGMI